MAARMMLHGVRRGALGAARAMPAMARPRRSVLPTAAGPAMRLDERPRALPGSAGGRAFSRNAALRMAAVTDTDIAGLEAKIKEQGDKVRSLKEAKADKEEIDAAVAVLKQLKADFEAQAGPIEVTVCSHTNAMMCDETQCTSPSLYSLPRSQTRELEKASVLKTVALRLLGHRHFHRAVFLSDWLQWPNP